MAQMHTEISMPARPSQVREVFLNFNSISTWHHDGMTIISATKAPGDLVLGDEITFGANGTALKPLVTENTPAKFSWRGNVFGILTGDHVFEFKPVEGKENKTLFVQSEKMGGVLAVLFTDWWPTWLGNMKPSTMVMFEKFNQDLKKKVVEG